MKIMIKIFSKKMLNFINLIYVKVFNEEVSPEVEKFIKNVSYVGIGTIIASIFSFSFNILAGRVLGPAEYGAFTLVQSIGMFLYIPMLLGFHTALVKYNSEKIDYFRQRNIISTTYIIVFLFTSVSILFYMVLYKEIITIFSISSEIFFFALIFAVLFVFYTLTTETLRSLHMIPVYSRLVPIFSIILFSSFLLLITLLKETSFKLPLFSMLLAYGITGGIVLAILRKYIIPEFSKDWALKLHRYSVFSLMGGLSAIFYLNIDKIIINIYMPVSNVGIYWAYNYSFTTLISTLISTFVIVFFPVASMCTNKKLLLERINKIILLLILIGWPLILITGCIILKMYGDNYPFDLYLIILFATAGICISADKLYGQLFCSTGEGGIKITSFAAIILALVNLLLNFLLIPLIGLKGAVIATIISYLFSISIMLLNRKSLENIRL